MNLMVLTVTAGIVLTLLMRRVTGRWFTPSTWYWIAWTLGLASVELAASRNLLPELTPLATTLILTSHACAAVGFVVGSIFGKLANGKAPRALHRCRDAPSA